MSAAINARSRSSSDVRSFSFSFSLSDDDDDEVDDDDDEFSNLLASLLNNVPTSDFFFSPLPPVGDAGVVR